MDLKKKLIGLSLIFIILMLLGSTIVNADMGNKPSIKMKINNLNTNNYIVDLFEESDQYLPDNYTPDSNYSYKSNGSNGDNKEITVRFDKIAKDRRNNRKTS